MTVVVLDRQGEMLDHHARWLAPQGEQLIAFTGTEWVPDRRNRWAYSEIHAITGYARTASLELAVLDVAARTTVTALVTSGHADLVRAGALRDCLGLPGQGRASAQAWVDLASLRAALGSAGIDVLPAHPVECAADLCWAAHTAGLPITVRRRREPGWPVVAELRDEQDLIAFLDRADGATWSGLVVEPGVTSRERHDVGAHRDRRGAGIAVAAAAALPDSAGLPLTVATGAHDGRTVVDSVWRTPQHGVASVCAAAQRRSGLPLAAVAS